MLIGFYQSGFARPYPKHREENHKLLEELVALGVNFHFALRVVEGENLEGLGEVLDAMHRAKFHTGLNPREDANRFEPEEFRKEMKRLAPLDGHPAISHIYGGHEVIHYLSKDRRAAMLETVRETLPMSEALLDYRGCADLLAYGANDGVGVYGEMRRHMVHVSLNDGSARRPLRLAPALLYARATACRVYLDALAVPMERCRLFVHINARPEDGVALVAEALESVAQAKPDALTLRTTSPEDLGAFQAGQPMPPSDANRAAMKRFLRGR